MPDGQQLADVLSEFASTMLTDFPIQAILDHLVQRIVDILPISSAGVTLIAPGEELRYIAATNEEAMRYEQLQTGLAEGPCLLAFHSGQAVTVPDLRVEDRFPTFRPQALAAGLGAVFTFPLRHGELRLGALDLYRQHPGALSAKTLDAAQTLANVVTAYLLNAEARQDLQDASDQSREASLHDPLTGLPNRALLLERMEHALLRGRRSGTATAVVFLDLDRLKTVNDRHGHRVGDELLIAVAKRLGAMLRPGDTLARLAGDEFVCICEDLQTREQATAIGTRLTSGLTAPFRLMGADVAITASIGIAFADHLNTADYTAKQLIHEADMAMYEAKRHGGHRQVMQPSHLRLTGLEQDLPLAMARGQLHVEYQPILATADRRIIGFEALLRWRHPTRGIIAPAVFVPLAEATGQISSIGSWVLAQAWTERHRWQQQYLGIDLSMAVNVSAHQLMTAGFVDTVSDVLATTADPPALLTLEITESVFIQDADRAMIVLHDLKKLGVTLALDDFGTGYSSLSHLKHFPVDIIKIDRSFIADLADDAASHSIVGAVVQLAHHLGMTVVAEGVETAEQHHQVVEIGCDYCQGFYFARPTPADQINTLISADPTDRSHRSPVLQLS